MNPNDAIATAYAAIALRAWTSNRERAAELTRMIDGWRATGGVVPEQLGRVRDVAHSLQGSAGTFGHDQAAEAAAALEQLLVTDETPQLEVLADAVARITLGLEEPPTGELSLGER